MTDNCIKLAKQLKNDERYEGLSIEAMLLVLIDSTDLQEVKSVLDVTDWGRELSIYKAIDFVEDDFLQRLKSEKSILAEKLEKLRAFVASEYFKKIDPVQMTLLNIQVKSMETYSQCLLERIVRLDVD